MLQLVDSHTHLDDFPQGEIPEVIQRAREANVGLIICAGTTLASSQVCVQLSQQHRILYAGVGLHPMNLEGPLDDETYKALERLALGNSKVVCISEIGLDFLPTSPDRQVQYEAFRRQIGLARELGLPIIFHSRESDAEVLQTLREERADQVGGVMHYFQGNEEAARAAMDIGFLISLAKPLLRLPHLQEVVKRLPLKSIVLETDSAPQPWKKYRHNWTEPSYVKMVAEKLAELKEMPVAEVVEQTTFNLLKLLKLNQDALAGPSSG